MTTRLPAAMRRQVVERAGNQCEYCLLHQDLAASLHQIDHVLAEKHGGQTTLDNVALSCTVCNRRKGSDLSSVDPETGAIVPFSSQKAALVGSLQAGRAPHCGLNTRRPDDGGVPATELLRATGGARRAASRGPFVPGTVVA